MATYEISYIGDSAVSYVYGSTPSQAKYNHYLRVCDCVDSFREFLSHIRSVRKVSPRRDAYDFITRQYGVAFHVGQAVDIAGEGSATGRVGEVIHPNGEGAYVSVLLDGKQCLFHPMSLIPTKPDKEGRADGS